MYKNKKRHFTLLLVAMLFIIMFVSQKIEDKKGNTQNEISKEKIEMAAVLDNRPNQIIEHTGYTVSYNESWKIPNWVAYELTSDEANGEVPRSNKFIPDPQAKGYVTTADYTGSGYDRGHMAPAGDMKWSEKAMKESFYLSNICPQIHNLNSGDWKELEEKCRELAKSFGSLYIACGPVVAENPTFIGLNNVAVPDSFFKVLLQITDNGMQTIGFLFRNVAGSKPLLSYVVTVDSIEKLSGIDFFVNLPDSLENVIEKSYDTNYWNLQ